MTQNEHSNERAKLWASLEPYAQLVKSLLPRATSINVFDNEGALQWSSETTTGPDLINLVEATMPAARTDFQSGGQLQLLGDQPVYICWLRDDGKRLIAVVAIICRHNHGAVSQEPLAFSFTQSLLRPALECLRRDLLARIAIDSLNRTVTDLDKDLEFMLTESGEGGSIPTGGTDDLKGLLQTAVEHLRCGMAALIVPDKGIVLVRSAVNRSPDNQLLARTHRQLVSMAQMRREPTIMNQLAQSEALGPIPYRILSCPVRHGAGKTIGVFALFRDITASEFVDRDARIADILARKAAGVIESNYDSMSGLFTRSAFEQRLRAVVAEKNRRAPWCALYIDSDQLHVINDNFGMHVGDTVIGQLGELIRRRLPPGSFGARISGDRFAALLPSTVEDTSSFAESLRAGAEQLGSTHANARLHVSISVGVAPLETESGELTHSLAAAETACKAAKDRGRNRVEVYQPNDQSIIRRFADINLAARLREAISVGRLRLDAQIIMPLDASGPEARPHFELLLRMIGEDGQTIGPDSFLSAANRYQLMPTIDRWVVDQALTLLKPHAELLAGRPAVFAINFSGQSLHDDGFSDFLLSRIASSGLDPGLFCFELTENATIGSIARAEALIGKLRGIGCEVALDDFGTGLSSLAYLRQLPVTMLKIDGSFVRDILKDPRSESMVHAIAQLARGMSLATVAEYVETDEIRARISALGVDYGQGFAIGRPEPFVDVLMQLPVLAAASHYTFDEPVTELRTANMY
jgi:diguanylate cyclase (GGDEF)-like protein